MPPFGLLRFQSRRKSAQEFLPDRRHLFARSRRLQRRHELRDQRDGISTALILRFWEQEASIVGTIEAEREQSCRDFVARREVLVEKKVLKLALHVELGQG